MSDPVHQLYASQGYPAMSHPLSDPAVSAVAAGLAGLKAVNPAKARVLEIGCSSGHNLLPLAKRWPESEFIGIDLAPRSIQEARERAAASGIENACFHASDLRHFDPAGPGFDYIIAHGFLSWVPDDVKAALFDFCRKNLRPSGIATVSFNVEAGWRARFPVMEKVRAIQQAGGGDIMSSLAILQSVIDPGGEAMMVIEDMLAKGPAILTFDDFAPVNDPWSLERFVRAAGNAGLRWLGESDPSENIPRNLSEDVVGSLAEQFPGPLEFHQALDDAAGRAFRSGILCRDDAPVVAEVLLDQVLDYSVRAGGAVPVDPRSSEIWQAIARFSPNCVPLLQAVADLEGWDRRDMSGQVYDGITAGWILPRVGPVVFDPIPPRFPCLDAFRLLCAREGLPLVDAWHKPCQFPAHHYPVLSAMNGQRSLEELAGLSADQCPDLAFGPWIRHLAGRGMFF